jgi:hypothetical protein
MLARSAAALVLALMAATCALLYFTPERAPVRLATVLTAAMVVIGMAGAIGLWLRHASGPWLALTAMTFAATLGSFAWTAAPRSVAALSVLMLATAAAIFTVGAKPSSSNNPYQRALFGTVLLFASWVAAWGWLYPAEFGRALPFNAPPLHARFLGAMYLSGATFMLLATIARRWSEIRVATAILAIWTGVLGVISYLHLAVFDWSRDPTWYWFVAYIGFPLLACWVAWCPHGERSEVASPPLPLPARGILLAIALAGTTLGLALLFAPRFMVTLWPWAVSPLLAHIYSAPFLAFGLGCLYAAAQRTWLEARIAAAGTFVFAIGVLVASWLHVGLFNFGLPSVWAWFGGFALVALALLAALVLQHSRAK